MNMNYNNIIKDLRELSDNHNITINSKGGV